MRSILTKSHLSLISLALSVGINRKVIVSLPTKLLKTNGIHYNNTPKSDSNGLTDPSSNHKCAGRHHLFCFIFKLCMLRFILILVHLVSFLQGEKFVIHHTFFGFSNGTLHTKIVTIIYLQLAIGMVGILTLLPNICF